MADGAGPSKPGAGSPGSPDSLPPAKLVKIASGTGKALKLAAFTLSPSKRIRQRGKAQLVWVRAQFKAGKCKHCNKPISLKNITRAKAHLLNKAVCVFLDSSEAKQLKARGESDVVEALAKASAAIANPGSAPITSYFPGSVSTSEKHELDLLLCHALVDTMIAFHAVENSVLGGFLVRLRPGYRIPSRRQVI
jgi:hypothetical protein